MKSYYFGHDDNSRSDEDIQELIFKMGFEGYGLYWAVVEELYKNGGCMKRSYDRIAFSLRTEAEKVRKVIEDFDLFKVKENKFTSERVLKELDNRFSRIKKAKKAARSRWSNASSNAKDKEIDKETDKEEKEQETPASTLFQEKLIKKFWKYLEKVHPATYKQFTAKKNKITNSWIKTLNWLNDNTVDTYTDDEILEAVRKAYLDKFWRKQFRSINKLKRLDKDGTRIIAKFLDLDVQLKKSDKISRWINGK